MQRQNKSHIISTQNNLTKQINQKKIKKKSTFSSSHHSKLCPRCGHIFLNPKTRLNQILQLYHIERRLKPNIIPNDNDHKEHKDNDNKTEIEQKQK